MSQFKPITIAVIPAIKYLYIPICLNLNMNLASAAVLLTLLYIPICLNLNKARRSAGITTKPPLHSNMSQFKLLLNV